MKIEVRNLKHSASLSEETHAFTADIYVDGVKTFYASNHGTGGQDMYHRVDGAKRTLAEVEAWVSANHPPMTYGDWSAPATLEGVVSDMINAQITRKAAERDLARWMKSKVMVLPEDGKGLRQFTFKGVKQITGPHIAAILRQHPNVQGRIVNTAPKGSPLHEAAIVALMTA